MWHSRFIICLEGQGVCGGGDATPRVLFKHEMKQKLTRGKKGGKKPLVRQSKKHDPIPPRWWKGKGSEAR